MLKNTPDRLPPIAEEFWTDEQRLHAKALLAGPRGAVIGPFIPLLRSPVLMDRTQHLGEYLRFNSALTGHLSEFAILITARHWSQEVEWTAHAPIALKAGLDAAAIQSVLHGVRPAAMSEGEAAVYDFATEMHRTRHITDATWARALACFGEKGIVDLLGILGYYTMLSIVMNGAQTRWPSSTEGPALPTHFFQPVKETP